APPRHTAGGGQGVCWEMSHAAAADMVGQRPGFRLEGNGPVAFRLLREALEYAQRLGAVVRAGQSPHLRTERALRERVQLAGLDDRVIGAELVAGVEPLLCVTQQRIHGQAMPMRPLDGEPV